MQAELDQVIKSWIGRQPRGHQLTFFLITALPNYLSHNTVYLLRVYNSVIFKEALDLKEETLYSY
jgi:hypothetical protein